MSRAFPSIVERADLERMDREALIARAEQAGVTRARVLTRPELVDELILRSAVDQDTKQRSRGLFGRARDLLASVVERGLHLPDAADRIRSVGGAAPVGRPSAPAALPTVTLAEIYAAQGHRVRAIETLERVLAREPDHAAARLLRAQLTDGSFPVPAPRLSPEGEDEAERGVPASVPPGDGGDVAAGVAGPREVDECVAIPVDPTTLCVCWQVRDRTLEALRRTRAPGVVALRLIVIIATWDGPRSAVRDYDVVTTEGQLFARELPEGSVVRVAVGYRYGDAFVPIAHSPALEVSSGRQMPAEGEPLLRRTSQGGVPVSETDPDAPAIARALARARRELA